MDMTHSIAPNSDQVNAEDLLSSPRTVTVTGVEAGTNEQPVFIHLEEFPNRTYRPSKSMRRILVAAWGPEASEYVGRHMTLFRNPEIRFGRDAVGGIQISHLSHIDGPLTVALTVTRGKRAPFTVQPLPHTPAPVPDGAWTPDGQPLKHLFALLKDRRPDLSDKATVLGYVSTVVGRDVTSSSELTDTDISTVIDALNNEHATYQGGDQ